MVEGKDGPHQAEGDLNPALDRAIKLTAAVAVLGSSLGVDVEKLFAATLGSVDIPITAVQDKDSPLVSFDLGSVYLKYEATFSKIGAEFYKYQGTPLDFSLDQIKADNSTDIQPLDPKLLPGQFKFSLTPDQLNLPAVQNVVDEFVNPDLLVVFPNNGADISDSNPFTILASSFPTIGDPVPNYTFLTVGISSIDGFFDVKGNLNITGVVPSGVPEPASLLILGSGFAGLAWTRRRAIQRRKRADR